MHKLVRLRCGATGLDIGHGHGLFVSAQDNDLSIDRINPDREPQEGLPVPSSADAWVARIALRAGYAAGAASV